MAAAVHARRSSARRGERRFVRLSPGSNLGGAVLAAAVAATGAVVVAVTARAARVWIASANGVAAWVDLTSIDVVLAAAAVD